MGDTEGDLAEVRRQKSDMKVVNTLAQELKMVAEGVPLQEKENEDVKMQDDERHDESGDVKRMVTNRKMDRWHTCKMVSSAMDLCQSEKFIPDRL